MSAEAVPVPKKEPEIGARCQFTEVDEAAFYGAYFTYARQMEAEGKEPLEPMAWYRERFPGSEAGDQLSR
jgi:hypothetical protein